MLHGFVLLLMPLVVIGLIIASSIDDTEPIFPQLILGIFIVALFLSYLVGIPILVGWHFGFQSGIVTFGALFLPPAFLGWLNERESDGAAGLFRFLLALYLLALAVGLCILVAMFLGWVWGIVTLVVLFAIANMVIWMLGAPYIDETDNESIFQDALADSPTIPEEQEMTSPSPASTQNAKNAKSNTLVGTLERHLEDLHKETLYPTLRIDSESGEIGHPSGRGAKFPTLPFVGSKYGEGPKILFVSLDIGGDEKPGGIQDFRERRQAIEDKPLHKHNPHIAGTYFAAMYLLRSHLPEMLKSWQSLEDGEPCKTLLKTGKNLPEQNPLSYVALTNYYKFVNIGRSVRGGPANQRYLGKDTKALEQAFFLQEVVSFEPEIIVFQSVRFKERQYRSTLGQLPAEAKVWVGRHPSARGKEDRVPRAMVNRFEELTHHREPR